MHTLLLPLGSTGDVLPFVGIGRALRARGHSVTIVANPHFAPLIARGRLDFAALGKQRDYGALCDSPGSWTARTGFASSWTGRRD